MFYYLKKRNGTYEMSKQISLWIMNILSADNEWDDSGSYNWTETNLD